MKSGKIDSKQKPCCPACKKILDGFSHESEGTPVDGSISICLYCSSINKFVFSATQGITLIVASDKDKAMLDQGELSKALKSVQMFQMIFQQSCNDAERAL